MTGDDLASKVFDLDDYTVNIRASAVINTIEEVLDSLYILEVELPDGETDRRGGVMFDKIREARDAAIDVRLALARQLKEMMEAE